jgi:hypothetical protein
MRDLLVAVGVASGNDWKAHMGVSLCGLIAYFYCRPVPLWGRQAITIVNKRGSILPRSRAGLVKRAFEIDATHLLFVDSDQTFEGDILHKLLECEKPIVACNIATKRFPANSTARVRKNGAYVPVYTKPESEGLRQVDRVGSGIMLVEMDVFRRIPQPWFNIVWREELDDYEGEDWFFLQKCEDAGIPVFIHHDASQDVGHVGEFVYKHKHTLLGRTPEELAEGDEENEYTTHRNLERRLVIEPGTQSWNPTRVDGADQLPGTVRRLV